MALLLLGITECKICQKVILGSEKYTVFTPFIDNEKDPLFFFNDSVFHTSCIKKHPVGKQAIKRQRELLERLSKRRMNCFICGCSLDDPNNFFMFGNLYEAENDLHLSYKQCHETCLPKLEGLNNVYQRLLQLQGSGTWDGFGPRSILHKLKKALNNI